LAYDHDLADRVRAVLPDGEAVSERQMFGGLTFMLGGHMLCGVVKDTLVVRLGPEAADRALEQPHVRPMDFTGRPMKGMVFIDPAGLHGQALRQWVDAAAGYVRGLPPSGPHPRASAGDPADGMRAAGRCRPPRLRASRKTACGHDPGPRAGE
jgi:TfoX/Sxy family transcriptional regulator of competence genes